MKEKAETFVEELKALCDKHDVTLAVSDYDALQVWDRAEGEDALHSAGVEDKTE